MLIFSEILRFFQKTLKWDAKPRRKHSHFDFSIFLENAMKKFCITSYIPQMNSKTCKGTTSLP